MLLLLLPALALAGPLRLPRWLRKKPDPEAVPTPTESAEPELPAPAPTLSRPLFPDQLPLDVGPHPSGLANVSAQGCQACHASVTQGWAGGPHAGGPSPAMLDIVERSGVSACISCHLPLRDQHERLPTWEVEDDRAENPSWSATLRSEGVTCAACHVRDGQIAVGTEDAARAIGPHMVALSPELGTSRSCATCHQLTWPGANVPLYDTYGEWERSAWAEAGVGCLDCHRAEGAVHGWRDAAGQGVSLLVNASSTTVVRGEAPLEVSIELQNTGAGHAVPTGSPFEGVLLRARLWKPGADGAPVAHESEVTAWLGRTLEAEPPWSTVEDTRLQAGASRTLPASFSLDVSEPAGRWELVVELLPTLREEPRDEPLKRFRLPLTVQ